MRTIRNTILAATLIMLGACAAAPTEDVMAGFVDDEQALARVWANTKVVFPHEPGQFFFRPEAGLDRAVAEFRPQNTPAIIYLHDCAELTVASTEMMKTVAGLAQAGFAVFVPHSMDRPRKPDCIDPNGYVADANAISRRLSELLYTRERIRNLAWVDQANVFAVGSGLGGVALTKLASAPFPAVTAIGVNCHPTGFQPGITVPDSTAVLIVLGSHDTTFRENLFEKNCAARPEMHRPNRNATLFVGVGHDVTGDPGAVPSIAEFLKSHATRPIRPARK